MTKAKQGTGEYSGCIQVWAVALQLFFLNFNHVAYNLNKCNMEWDKG